MNNRFKFRFFNKLSNEYENTYDLQSCEVLDYVIPEQCTGLKDKNGKLIYEGDIVKKGDTIAEVFWDDGCYAIRTRDNRVCWLWNNLYEVIGNIHENADLLEFKND